MKVCAAVLADLPTEVLITGLAEAMATSTGWMTPAQVREVCLGSSNADEALAASDEAWAWLTRYLRDHGVNQRVKLGRLTGTDEATGMPTFAAEVPAPMFPEPIMVALEAIGGTCRNGLVRVNEATGSDATFLKREFAAAYQRAGRRA